MTLAKRLEAWIWQDNIGPVKGTARLLTVGVAFWVIILATVATVIAILTHLSPWLLIPAAAVSVIIFVRWLVSS